MAVAGVIWGARAIARMAWRNRNPIYRMSRRGAYHYGRSGFRGAGVARGYLRVGSNPYVKGLESGLNAYSHAKRGRKRRTNVKRRRRRY